MHLPILWTKKKKGGGSVKAFFDFLKSWFCDDISWVILSVLIIAITYMTVIGTDAKEVAILAISGLLALAKGRTTGNGNGVKSEPKEEVTVEKKG
jgi:hypothetical protein